MSSPARSSLAASLLLITALAAGSCGGSVNDRTTKEASPSHLTKTPSADGHYQEFLDPDGHFKIEYPIDWSYEAQAGDVFVPPGPTQAGVIVAVASYEFLPPPSPKEQMHDRLPDLNLFPGTEILDEGVSELSGYPAYFAHWFDTSSGRTLEVFEVLTNGDASGRLYSIRLDGPPPDVQVLRQEYRSIVDSFRILDAPDDGIA